MGGFPVDPARLTWARVGPAHHPFDPGGVADVVRRWPAAASVPVRPPGEPHDPAVLSWGRTTGAAWVRAMSADLVDHYGPWASGWCWSVGEGDIDGDPSGPGAARTTSSPRRRRPYGPSATLWSTGVDGWRICASDSPNSGLRPRGPGPATPGSTPSLT